jgi:hypothetical protein
LWNEVRSSEDFVSFLDAYFENRVARPYMAHIKQNLAEHPFRTTHPYYFHLATRSLLMAAEYQYPGLVNHLTRHDNHKWKRDLLSPVHLLALGVYLAQGTVILTDAKAQIYEAWNQKDKQFLRAHVPIVLHAWVRPRRLFPSADDFATKKYPGYISGRRQLHLPVLIPDISFLRRVATIPLSGDDADCMDQYTFATHVLPQATKMFFPRENPQLVADLFLNDAATWSV